MLSRLLKRRPRENTRVRISHRELEVGQREKLKPDSSVNSPSRPGASASL